MKKKVVSSLLAGTMLFAAFSPATAYAEEELRNISVLGYGANYAIYTEEDREKFPHYNILKEQLAEEKLALDMEIISQEQYPTVLQTRLASGDLADIVNLEPLSNEDAVKLGKQGVILPIDQVLQENGGEEAWNYLQEKLSFVLPRITADDGHVYWLPTINPVRTYEGDKEGYVAMTVVLRQDWLEKLGLSMPETPEEFKEVLHAFQDQDANGNGAKDEIVAIDPVRKLFTNGIAQWFGLGLELATYDEKNEQVVCPWYQEGIKDYILYMKSLVDEGLIDTNLIGLESSDPLNQKMAENAVSAKYDYGSQSWLEPATGDENAYYAPLMPLQALEGVDPYVNVEDGFGILYKFAVGNNCEDLEAVADFFNYIYSDEFAEFGVYGVKGESFTDEKGYNTMVGDFTLADYSEREKLGALTVNNMFGYMIPIIRYTAAEEELDVMEANAPEKYEFTKAIQTYEAKYSMDITNFQTLPSDEQAKRLSEIRNELTTYSKELMANLILGRASMDDWDSYMEELKEIGLDDYLEIQQNLVDNYKKVQQG